MAYSDVYRSQSQSSNSAMYSIDGLEMKISERLAPPPMVTIPPEYQPGNPSEILFMEYDFRMEERVIEWSKQQRLNEEAMRHAQTKKIGEAIQSFSQQAEAAATEAANGGSSESASAPGSAPVPPAANPSPFINLGSGILTPMPIGSGHKRQESGGNKAQIGLFDLTDFENEQDPFENMELKVLNDREELNKMMFEAQQAPLTANAVPATTAATSDPVNSNHVTTEPAAVAPKPSRPSPPGTPVNLQDVDYPEIEALDSGQYPLPTQPRNIGQQQYGNVPYQTNAQRAYYQPTQNVPGSTLQQYGYNQNMPLPPISKAQYLMQQQGGLSTSPTYIDANSLSMPSTASSVAGAQPDTNSVNVNAAAGTAAYMPYQNYYSRHSVTNHNTNTANGHLLAQPDPSQLTGAPGGQQTPPLNPLRSARSTPDISGSEERRLPPLMPSSQTPPPTARSSSPNDLPSSSSPPVRPPSQQVESELEEMNWNHYSILPPSPRSSTNTPTLNKAVVNAKPKLPNPFDELSHDAQRYVESVTDMGFPRARVARAVKKLGSDDKKVIDHLCMVNRLAEQGHDSDDAEAAILLFENNLEKAEQYLKLLSQFKEIGFRDEKIQEALVSTNLDENKTLDLLTAS